MGYPGENRRLSEDTISTLERHHAFLQQFRAELAGSLKHEKATGWLSRRSKGENSLLSRDNILPINLNTLLDVQREIAGRFKARRLALNLTQEGLAARSGVSWSSLKRFEGTGLIALDSLLRIALVLDCLGDFDRVCLDERRNLSTKSLDEILTEPTRKKGRLK